MKIIDVHTHAYPDALAPKAMAGLCAVNRDVEPATDGTASGLLEAMDRGGVSVSFVLPIATKPKQAPSILKWIRSFSSERLIPFGSVHPFSENFEQELEAFRSAGIKGIKLHPMYQDFSVDDRSVFPVYEALSDMNFTVIFHAGYDIAFPESMNASADKFVTVMENFPELRIIAAHMGGWKRYREVRELLCGRDIWFDTSFINEIPEGLRREIFASHDMEKFLFGTDCPWARAEYMAALLESFPELSAESREKIFYRNAERLLNL